jgi:hypothetical protein
MRAAGQWAQFEPGALPPVVQCVGANFLASEIYRAMIAAALCDSGSDPEGEDAKRLSAKHRRAASEGGIAQTSTFLPKAWM